MTVPYVDLPAQHAPLRARLLEAFERVLDHGQFILGPEVAALEARLSERLDGVEVVTCGSGTDALLLALRLHGIGPGDEVLTVSHSFVATASAVRLVGATPVFVDIDRATMLMDPGRLEEARTPRTRAVLPVHLNGFPCPMEPIAAFCERHGLVLIEDCAQAFGARWRDRAVGSFGVGCFSLHPLKVLSALGDGGFLTLRDPADASRLRRMRNLGLLDRDRCVEVSGNSRLDALQAALLLVKLDLVDEWIERRRAHAAAYRAALGDVLTLPPESPDALATPSAFVVRHPRRDRFLAGLRAREVDAKVHYPLAIHQQPAFADLPARPLAVTEQVVNEIVSLPISAELSLEGRAQVIAAARAAAEEAGA